MDSIYEHFSLFHIFSNGRKSKYWWVQNNNFLILLFCEKTIYKKPAQNLYNPFVNLNSNHNTILFKKLLHKASSVNVFLRWLFEATGVVHKWCKGVFFTRMFRISDVVFPKAEPYLRIYIFGKWPRIKLSSEEGKTKMRLLAIRSVRSSTKRLLI